MQALAAARFPDRIELNRERAMRVIRARNLSVGLMLLLATGCSSSGGFSSASMPSWWPWGKKTPAAPETGLADNGYPQSPAVAAQQQQAQPGANYGPPAYGYPQTDPALAYGNPTYGTTPASYTGAPTTPAPGAQPAAYGSAGLYDANAAAAYTQPGYGAPAQQQPYYPSADQGQPAANVAMQNQYYNPDYARAAAPAAAPADPAAAQYGYPAAGAPAAYSDPSYATQPPTTAATYPQAGYGTPDAGGAPVPQYGAAAYTADTRSAAPGTPGAPEMQGAGAYPGYAPSGDGTTTGGSAWSNTAAPTAPTAVDPAMNQPPGQTGYVPGQNGYQPAGTSAYQAPAASYQTPGMPPAAAPAAGGARGATPYRPGSTGDYRSSGANTFRAATPGGEYEPSAGVSPASYEAVSAPEAPSATVTP
jgi:far upstream element-binding protein